MLYIASKANAQQGGTGGRTIAVGFNIHVTCKARPSVHGEGDARIEEHLGGNDTYILRRLVYCRRLGQCVSTRVRHLLSFTASKVKAHRGGTGRRTIAVGFNIHVICMSRPSVRGEGDVRSK